MFRRRIGGVKTVYCLGAFALASSALVPHLFRNGYITSPSSSSSRLTSSPSITNDNTNYLYRQQHLTASDSQQRRSFCQHQHHHHQSPAAAMCSTHAHHHHSSLLEIPSPIQRHCGDERDPNSYSNPNEVAVKHLHLALAVDFKTEVLAGAAFLTLEQLQKKKDGEGGAQTLVLDTRGLIITAVSIMTAVDASAAVSSLEKAPTEPLAFAFGAETEHDAFGRSLIITLPSSSSSSSAITGAVVKVEYSTTPSASAIQWLPPQQTAGKVHPYLFTQCQAIHARSMVPIQDTPSNKFTYSATVTVPKPLVALMSAKSLGAGDNDAAVGGDDDAAAATVSYSFEQKVPIPSYLLALAVGALESRDIGPRSKVWSEKEMVESGAFEFAETERFIATAESIVGPYVWGHYDILLLPPSFPYGGMENPCLTFVTPTLLAGDRSLADVVAHEIAHSWFGNLVTSNTWEHFWMNEGFTVFLERKIVKAMKSKEAQHLSAQIGWKALEDSVNGYGASHPYTCMHVKLDGVDPDDAFSSIPYEKGFNFLFHLESIIGEEAMNKFLAAHCERYKYGTVNTQEWQQFFMQYVVEEHKLVASREVLESLVDFEFWFHKPGMPPKPAFDETLSKAAFALADAVVAIGSDGDGGSSSSITADAINGWESSQTVVFLERLQAIQSEKLAAAPSFSFQQIMATLDATFNFTASKNSEIRFRWYTLAIKANYSAAFPAVVSFLSEQGRMKFIRPLYRDLFANPSSRQLAVDTFQQYRRQYHMIAQKMVAKDLQLS